MTSKPGHWINGVNMANTPAFLPDGRCRVCGEGIEKIETSMPAAPPRAMTERVDPPKIKGPYYVPCGHDAADAFGGRGGGLNDMTTHEQTPASLRECSVVITDDGPGVVMALCRHHGMIVRDSALSWDYLVAMVNAHATLRRLSAK